MPKCSSPVLKSWEGPPSQLFKTGELQICSYTSMKKTHGTLKKYIEIYQYMELYI